MLEGNWLLDAFDEDYIREDENSATYSHYLTGEPSTSNVYYNRFYLEDTASFSAVEIGVTNDFNEVSIYLNGMKVFEEKHHRSNGKNYFR